MFAQMSSSRAAPSPSPGQTRALLHIVAADGTEIASFTATKSFSSVVYSSAGIASGATYSVYTEQSVSGRTLVGTFTAGTAPTGGMTGGRMGGGTPPAGGGRPGGRPAMTCRPQPRAAIPRDRVLVSAEDPRRNDTRKRHVALAP